MSDERRYIHFFKDLGIGDVPLVGGKNASLGEMFREMSAQGVRVPNGFAIVADAYRYVLERAGAMPRLKEALAGLDPANVTDLAARARKMRDIVYGAGLPDDLKDEILAAYRSLQDEYGPTLSLAVRSSATAEDLPDASFAGMHESFLNVHGDAQLLDACRRCFASIFTDRAIHYWIDEGFDHFKIALSIGVMKMVRSDLAASGVIFTLDTESGFRDVLFITGAYGLGENIGSNDLTQLTLGMDRDSEIVAFDYDERDEGVKAMIRLAVEGCQRNHRHSGLCGQAPSDYPDMAAFLVELGIDSISLNPDAVIKTTLNVLEVEKRLGRRGG